uniref:Uncharacterized protein n=1 Tax=Cacopsylla melanoneura TaxID=428564 RepID=A0A8D8YYH9_9HEMI
MEQMIGWFVIFFALSSVVSAFPEDSQPQEYQHEHPDEFTDEHRRHSYRPHRDQPEKSNERDDDEGYDRRRGEYQTVAPHRHRTYKHHRRHRHPHPQPQPDLAEEMVESTEASYQTEATEQHAEESNSNQMAANIAQTKSLEPDTFDDESTDPVEAEAKLGWPEWIMMVFLRGKTFVQNVWEGGKAVGNAAVTGGKAVGNAAVTGGKAVGNAAVAVGDAAKTVYGWMRCGANGVVRAYRVINHWYDLPEGTSPNPTDMSPTTSSSDSSDG